MSTRIVDGRKVTDICVVCNADIFEDDPEVEFSSPGWPEEGPFCANCASEPEDERREL